MAKPGTQCAETLNISPTLQDWYPPDATRAQNTALQCSSLAAVAALTQLSLLTRNHQQPMLCQFWHPGHWQMHCIPWKSQLPHGQVKYPASSLSTSPLGKASWNIHIMVPASTEDAFFLIVRSVGSSWPSYWVSELWSLPLGIYKPWYLGTVYENMHWVPFRGEHVLCVSGLGSDCVNEVWGRYYGEMASNLILSTMLCWCDDVLWSFIMCTICIVTATVKIFGSQV